MKKSLFGFLLVSVAVIIVSCRGKKYSSGNNKASLFEVAAGQSVKKSSQINPAPTVLTEVVIVSADDGPVVLQPKILDMPEFPQKEKLISHSAPNNKAPIQNNPDPKGDLDEIKPELDKQAVASFILGLASLILSPGIYVFVLPLVILALVYSVKSLERINASEGKLRGKGLAITGFILGGLGLVVILTAGLVALWMAIMWW